MNVTGNETTADNVTNTWENASLYYSMPSDDPDLLGCQPIILKTELQDFLAWKWWIGGLVMILIEIIGFIANSMSLVVLLRPKIRELSFNQLLTVLCIVDTFFIFCNTFSCIHALGFKSDSFKTVRGIMDAFGQVAMCGSVLLIVALTCERHFAIRSPHRYRIHILTTPWWKHLSYYVVPVSILSLIFNIPMFINLQRKWMKNTTYLEVNLYLRMLHPLTTTGLAPILILMILNVRITLGIRNMQSKAKTIFARPTQSAAVASQETANTLNSIQTVNNDTSRVKKTSKSQQQNRREIRMAYLTFAIVTLFFLLNLPRIALGGYEVSNTWLILRCVAKGSKYLSTLTFYRWDTISRLLMVINSSINFLIYCAGSQQFKEEFFAMFVPRCLYNLRKRLISSEAQPQETIQTNGVRLEVPKNGHDNNGRQGPNTENTTVVVHQKGVCSEIM